MNKRTWLVIVGALIVVLLVALIVWQLTKNAGSGNQAAGGPGGAAGTASSTTRLPVPVGTTVPDANSSVSGDVAKPQSVTQAAPGVTSKIRTFSVQINHNTFTPAEFDAYVGDIVSINFTAVDKDYDVVQPDYGFKLTIPKGQTKLLQGQYTSAGKYIFYCQSCGGPQSGPVGYLVAVPKQ